MVVITATIQFRLLYPQVAIFVSSKEAILLAGYSNMPITSFS